MHSTIPINNLGIERMIHSPLPQPPTTTQGCSPLSLRNRGHILNLIIINWTFFFLYIQIFFFLLHHYYSHFEYIYGYIQTFNLHTVFKILKLKLWMDYYYFSLRIVILFFHSDNSSNKISGRHCNAMLQHVWKVLKELNPSFWNFTV